jgi:hypothetical protein
VEERKRMLVTASGVQTRNLLYDEKEGMESWKNKFEAGKVKGSINCILNDRKRIHKINKVIKMEDGESRLTQVK